MSETAVILMAYGSPERVADVPAYYADIRGGRPISPENLEDLVARYRALGIEDSNPLNAITEATRAALEDELGLPVFTGMKHWTPRIADAVEAALAGGRDAPRRPRARAALQPALDRAATGACSTRRSPAAPSVVFVESWHDDPGLVAFLADRVRDTDAHVVFTAHSLPARILDEGDPYQDQLLETARLVADSAGVEDWSFSFQSESPTGEPWLGPDILDHLEDLSAARRGGRARLPRRLRVGSSGDPLGHRHRGAGQGARARAAARADRDAERRPALRPRARRDRARRARGGRGMNDAGRIVVDRVSRTFRVYPKAQRTLKDVFVSRGRLGVREVQALRDVSLDGRAGRRRRPRRPQRLGQDDAAARSISGIIKPTSGRVEAGGRIASLLELGAGFHPDFTRPRERLPQRLDPRPARARACAR